MSTLSTSPIAFKKKPIIRVVILLAAAYFILFGILVLTLKPGIRSTDITIRGLYVLSIICAFAACFWASINTIAYKRLWRLMSIGIFLWAVGESIFFLYVIKYGLAHVPSPSIADYFVVAYLPIILGVMFSLGKIRLPFDNEKKQFLANVLTMALAAFLLCYQFILIPAWYSNPNMSVVQRMYAIGYPLFDWIVLVSLLLASHRLQGRQIEGWFILLISAFSFAIVAVLIFYLLHNQRNPFTSWAWTGAAILVTLSAIDEVTGVFIGVIDRPHEKSIFNDSILIQDSRRTLLVPFVSSIVIPITWVSYSFNGHKSELLILGSVTVAILMLLIYRNHLLISDNAVLFTKALRDNLTGLNNHRYFQEALNKTIKKAEKTNKQVSLIMLDVDNFSQLNNANSHVFGDKILTIIGGTILSNLRENDEACRLSGDKFGIILPQTSEFGARTLAIRIKNSVEEVLTKLFPGKSITVTLGISTFPTLAQDKDELLYTTDGALYWAKLCGKNNVLLYNPKVVKTLSADERAKRAEEVAIVDLVRSLAKAVDARDPYTRLHSKRVSDLSKKLAKFMGLDNETINRIEVAGILHDVGKIGIPDNILNKPGRLTNEEMITIKNHPVLSAQMIRSTSLKELVPIIRAHHERWDGSGYPIGLKGEKIPLEARILALADSFDAMTSDRPYRKTLSVEDALKEIKSCAGTQFDPQLVEYFLSMFINYYGFVATSEEPCENQAGLDYKQAAVSF